MTKSKSKPKAPRSASRKTSRPKPRARSALASAKTAARPNTKHARIIAMLRSPGGATIVAVMTATEWQQHSVRGFLAGVSFVKGLGSILFPNRPTRAASIASGMARLRPPLRIARNRRRDAMRKKRRSRAAAKTRG